MLILSLILGVLSFIFVIYVGRELEKEKKRNRVLQAFVSGIITSISNYENKMDSYRLMMKMGTETTKLAHDGKREYSKGLPIDYKKVLGNVSYELFQDFGTEDLKNIEELIKFDRALFGDYHYDNCGFNLMYVDLFESIKQEIEKHKE